MFILVNEIRQSAWGSRSVIAKLTGRDYPTEYPEAEMWLGAHPLASSEVISPSGSHAAGVKLVHLIDADPIKHLGPALYAEYETRLPFLFKVLAADSPLSIQAHPNRAQAREGFEREEAQGIDRDDPKRNYKDTWPKPELFVAMSECEVLCGFRGAEEASQLLARLGIRLLTPYVASLLTGNPADGMRVAVTTLLSLPRHKQTELVGRVVEESKRLVQRLGPDDEDARAYQCAIELGAAYPDDIGVVLSLMLRRITLAPLQAVFLGAGQMHAYLKGWGLEAQANSDNTLRCGLTGKHVDVAELLRIIDFEPTPSPVIEVCQLGPEAGEAAGMLNWPTEAREFDLCLVEVAGHPVPLRAVGPQILLCLEGEVAVRSADDEIALCHGASVYIENDETEVHLSGHGRVARVCAGRVARSH